MTFLRVFSTTSALALIAGPALADLSADQVWNDWKDLLGSYGAEISTGSEDLSGGTLFVTGLQAGFKIDEGAMSIDLGDVTFAERGDGSVVVTMEDELPLVMDITAPDGKKARVGFTLKQPGAQLIASGDAANMRYDFDYPSMAMSDFTLEGDDIPGDLPMTFDITAAGIAGFITLASGSLRRFETESSIASLAMNMNIDDPNEGKGAFQFSMTELRQTASGTLADIEMDMSAAQMIGAGMAQSGHAAYGPSNYAFSIEAPDGAMDLSGSASGGTLDFSFDQNGLSYGGVTNDVSFTVGGPMIPFPPLTFTMEKSEGRLTMPMVPHEEEQNFAVVMTMIGLKIDDMLWSMFDAAGMLPHDPATIVVDVSGTAIVTHDFTDPAVAETLGETPPGTIESLDINSVQLKLAGAELTGDGEFAFNNDMGIPLPSGTVNMMLTGGNTLLDTLVAMGLIPEDQAMGARMMLGLFARPGDGPDTLVSTIEVNEDGSILANGQRIK